MFSKLRSYRPSHAVVVAYLALFVALGGSSYAALRVGSKQIVNNSVRSKDIRNNDVRSGDVRNASLLAKDFKPGQLPAAPRPNPNAINAQNAQNADRLDGHDSRGFAKYPTVRIAMVGSPPGTITVPPGGLWFADARCEPDEKAIAGGGASRITGDWDLVESYPLPDPREAPPIDAWRATFRNATSRPLGPFFQGYAICVS